MKRLLVPLLTVLVTVCGCSHQYVIKMTNGTELSAPHKPKLVGNSYRYEDSRGHQVVIPAGRVTEVAPASVAAEEDKESQKKYAPVTQKAHHWYWPF